MDPKPERLNGLRREVKDIDVQNCHNCISIRSILGWNPKCGGNIRGSPVVTSRIDDSWRDEQIDGNGAMSLRNPANSSGAVTPFVLAGVDACPMGLTTREVLTVDIGVESETTSSTTTLEPVESRLDGLDDGQLNLM
jgi:hypothetical protein